MSKYKTHKAQKISPATDKILKGKIGLIMLHAIQRANIIVRNDFFFEVIVVNPSFQIQTVDVSINNKYYYINIFNHIYVQTESSCLSVEEGFYNKNIFITAEFVSNENLYLMT